MLETENRKDAVIGFRRKDRGRVDVEGKMNNTVASADQWAGSINLSSAIFQPSSFLGGKRVLGSLLLALEYISPK
jgi:hypothetical protein